MSSFKIITYQQGIGFLILVPAVFLITIRSSFGLGIGFVENKGQWDKEILFRAEIPSGYLFFEKSGLSYLFYESPLAHAHHEHHHIAQRILASSKPQIAYHSLKVSFHDCTQGIEIEGRKPRREQYNFLKGDQCQSSVRSFSEIHYINLFPNINAKFYLTDNGLKYDFIVKPGGDPNDIKLLFEGSDDITVEGEQLRVRTSLQDITELAPFSFQPTGNYGKKEIKAHFQLDNKKVSFSIEDYDRDIDLIIDPALVFSTFSGSTADNWGFTAAFDDEGNTYSGGAVSLPAGGSIPTTTGAYSEEFQGGTWDVAIFKYDSTGNNLIYGTYLGGSSNEYPHSLVVNNNGELLVLGSTGSTDFPTTSTAVDKTFGGGQSVTPIPGLPFPNGSDIFISKLSADGSTLLASTFLGGSENDGIGALDFTTMNIDQLVKNYGDQFRGDIIVDGDDNIYIVSNTNSSDFPTQGGFQLNLAGGKRDGVIAKYNSDLSAVVWSTYIGGTGEDVAYSLKVVENNDVLIAGGTNSNDLPGVSNSPNGGIDGFAAIINHDGTSIKNALYIGTPNDDQAYFVDFDADFNVYLLGQTQGNYPVSPGVFFNANGGQFVHKLTPDLANTLFTTKFGSGTTDVNGFIIPDISPTAFLVSECNKFYLSGWGSPLLSTAGAGYQGLNLTGLPLTPDAFQTNPNNGSFYMAVFEENAQELVFATYFGGSIAPSHVDGGTSRFDKKGIIYQSVCSCGGANDDFPTTSGAWSETNNAFPVNNAPRCNNAVFKFDLATLSAGLSTNSVLGDNPGVTDLCIPTPILFANTSNGGVQVTWDLGDGTVIENMDSVIHEYQQPGNYNVSIRIEDESTCEQVDVATTLINVREGDFTIIDDMAICEGSSLQLVATGADNYVWTPNNPASEVLTEESPTVAPVITTQYTLDASTLDGCQWKDSVEVRVVPLVSSDFEIEKEYACMEFPTFRLRNLSAPSELLTWSFGDGNTADQPDISYQYSENGDFEIRLQTQTEFCVDFKSEEIRSDRLFLPNVITPNGDNSNDVFFLPNDGNAELSIVNRFGDVVLKTDDYQNDWDASGLPGGVYYYNLIMPDTLQTTCKGVIHVLR